MNKLLAIQLVTDWQLKLINKSNSAEALWQAFGQIEVYIEQTGITGTRGDQATGWQEQEIK